MPSRVLLAPINTGFAPSGRPSFALLRFHQERSGPAIGISTLGNVATHLAFIPHPNTPILASRKDVGRFSVIARAIKVQGSLAGIQLANSPAGLTPQPNWVAPDPAREIERLRLLIHDLPPENLRHHLSRFISSATLAAKAGFDMIQIHAAHGYLLSLLLSPAVNTRSDEFRFPSRWLPAFIDKLKSTVGHCILSFRISLFTGLMPTSDEFPQAQTLASTLAAGGVDLIDLSSGFYTLDRRLIYPNRDFGAAPYYPFARIIANLVSCLVSFAGNVTDLRLLPDDMPPNLLVSVGRALIADPQFAQKSLDGRYQDVNWCRRTGRCHYFSRSRWRIECGVNPRLGLGGDHDK